nr:MAG TPA: hypothetical protein [Caudoviricetes sp.]
MHYSIFFSYVNIFFRKVKILIDKKSCGVYNLEN